MIGSFSSVFPAKKLPFFKLWHFQPQRGADQFLDLCDALHEFSQFFQTATASLDLHIRLSTRGSRNLIFSPPRIAQAVSQPERTRLSPCKVNLCCQRVWRTFSTTCIKSITKDEGLCIFLGCLFLACFTFVSKSHLSGSQNVVYFY